MMMKFTKKLKDKDILKKEDFNINSIITKKAIEEARTKKLKRFNSIEELMNDLNK